MGTGQEMHRRISLRPANRRRLGSLAAASAAIFLALAASLSAAAPAAAHAELTSSAPVAGEILETPPSEVMLVFSDDITAIGTEVTVTSASDGTTWSTAAPEIDGTAVIQQLGSELPDDDYLVSYRIVSADGHPVTGTMAFTVGLGAPSTPGEGSVDGSDDAPDSRSDSDEAAPTSPASAVPISAPIAAEESSTPVGLIVTIVVVILLIVAGGIAYLIVRRHRQEPLDLTDDIDRAAAHDRVRRTIAEDVQGPDDDRPDDDSSPRHG